MASPGKKHFPLRIDPSVWAELEKLAAQELRSVNAQVEYLLREALARRGRRVPGTAAARPQVDTDADTRADDSVGGSG